MQGFAQGAVAPAAASPAAPPETPLKEISVAAGSFVRGAPLPAWADVLSIPPAKNIQRPVVESLFTVNGTACVVQPNC